MSRKFLIFLSVLALIALLVPSMVAQDETFEVTIVHTNDTHAGHEPQSNGNGGVARQATVVSQVAAEVDNMLLLDAGDRFSGTLYHTTFVGQDQVLVMNELGYDAMTLGNHEFDNGEEVLAAFLAGINFPAVVANIDFSASADLADLVAPYTIIEMGGEQIGITGLLTAETVDISSPGDDLVWRDDYAAAANEVAAELAEMGVNKVILLTHLGISADLAMLPELEGVDVVIGGHSHTLLSNTYAADRPYPVEETSAAGEPIVYVQALANNIYVGRLDLEFDANGVLADWGGDTILLSRYIQPDFDMSLLVARLSVAVDELRGIEIGATADIDLNGDRTFCRIEECALGDIIADAMRWETDAQIAIMNGGGIRASIPAGEITLGQVLTVHPFGNQIATFEIMGEDILAALENGVSRLQINDAGQVSREGLEGRFPQVSGLRYTVDATLEAGSRIVSVEVMNDAGEYEALVPDAIYSVVTNNFVRNGGDGYSMFAENAINPYDFGRLDYEVTADYLASLGTITEWEAEGRITYVNAEPAPVE